MSERCTICKRLLSVPEDPASTDCGGDCIRCMALIGNDPDCMTGYIENLEKKFGPNANREDAERNALIWDLGLREFNARKRRKQRNRDNPNHRFT